jgi:hypothetical protein
VTHEYPPEEAGGGRAGAGADAGEEGGGAPGSAAGVDGEADEEPGVGDADAADEDGIDATVGVDAATGPLAALVWEGRA